MDISQGHRPLRTGQSRRGESKETRDGEIKGEIKITRGQALPAGFSERLLINLI